MRTQLRKRKAVIGQFDSQKSTYVSQAHIRLILKIRLHNDSFSFSEASPYQHNFENQIDIVQFDFQKSTFVRRAHNRLILKIKVILSDLIFKRAHL